METYNAFRLYFMAVLLSMLSNYNKSHKPGFYLIPSGQKINYVARLKRASKREIDYKAQSYEESCILRFFWNELNISYNDLNFPI